MNSHHPDILMVEIPVPVPEIKMYSRWRVFLSLFNPKAHFTTCDTLQHQLRMETKIFATESMERWKKNRWIYPQSEGNIP
jgi:hypothetical protein